jgi:hypothetical protein
MKRYVIADLAAIVSHARAHGWTGRKPTVGMKICAIIDAAARRAGVSPREIVLAAGVHHDVYGKWRRGATQPSMRIIERLEAGGIEIL